MCSICGKSAANNGSRLGDGTHWALGDVGLPLLLINQRMGQMQMRDFSPGTTKGSFPFERDRAQKEFQRYRKKCQYKFNSRNKHVIKLLPALACSAVIPNVNYC